MQTNLRFDHQLLAVEGEHDVHCMLELHAPAAADGGEPDRCIEIPHADKRLWTYKLDLSGAPKQVAGALADLAGWIEQRTIRPLEAVS
jgi:hypothetical protein